LAQLEARRKKGKKPPFLLNLRMGEDNTWTSREKDDLDPDHTRGLTRGDRAGKGEEKVGFPPSKKLRRASWKKRHQRVKTTRPRRRSNTRQRGKSPFLPRMEENPFT